MAKRTKDRDLVMTCAPLRVSFAGGGTDLCDFYEKEDGVVVSSAIDKFVYVTIKRHGRIFRENYRLNYAATEHVNELDEIKNDIARECLRLVPVEPPLYISTVGDVPAESGLGGSSSFAVALLKGLHAMRGERISPSQLAEEAAHVEIDVLARPIGKQDQSAAAYGGFNCFRFLANGTTSLEPHSPISVDLGSLFEHIQMFWTGIARESASVLTEQKQRTGDNIEYLRAMRDQAEELNGLMRRELDIELFGRVLDEGWKLKKELASSISSSEIDAWYERARGAGALGGKLCGAGGGGFLLFVARPE
ncbi:MAG: hypothetical protein R3282_00375, partial [Rhodothermales bacterium]|nr:hypothetical protein [Rhodothermales bacterium]